MNYTTVENFILKPFELNCQETALIFMNVLLDV